MKIQDILFIVVLISLILTRKPRWLIITGILCFVASIPGFALWKFFTAQHLTYYAAGYIFVGLLIYIIQLWRFKKL